MSIEKETRNGATISDRREDGGSLDVPAVVATDRFMSGWGQAPGRSLFALPVGPEDNVNRILDKMADRSDMMRPRFVLSLRNVKLYAGDHLSIRDRGEASSWYQ